MLNPKRKPANDDALLAAICSATSEPARAPTMCLDPTVYLPELSRTSYGMNADILCSALFGVAKGSERRVVDGVMRLTRKHIRQVFRTTNGATIEYRGEELRQSDLTVLLELLHLRAGMAASCEIEFSPYTFCSQIGWSDSRADADRLKESLLRMRQSIVIVERDGAKGGTVGFVSQFSWDGAKWTVTIDERIGGLFSVKPTYLIIAQRKALSQGLQTWLYGYVRANRCGWAVPLETIHNACGSESKNMQEFARSVREALKKLAAIHVVTPASTVKNGKVLIFKT
jgi:hypothetical protein